MMRRVFPALAVAAACFGPVVEVSPCFAECPAGDRMNQIIRVPRGAAPMSDLWDLGADDLGVTGDFVDLRVCPHMTAALDAAGVPYDVMEADLQAAYEQWLGAQPGGKFGVYSAYHDYDEVLAELNRIVEEFPEIAALEVIGQSVEGRDIWAIRISDNAPEIEAAEPGMMLMGCHHAREWISVEVPLYFADYLTDQYREDGDVTRLVNYTEIWIIPVLNPDGFIFTHVDPEDFDYRWWRKNRRDNGDGTFGVDPNRNYSVGWGDDAGSSPYTWSEVYRGTSAFSEPETQALRDAMLGGFGRTFVSALSFHNYSQLVMYPNGYTTEEVSDVSYYESLAGEMAALINANHTGTQYDYIAGQTSRLLYIASGDFTDWAHHAADCASIIIELRPKASPWFELPANEILPTCHENVPAFLYMAEHTMIEGFRDADADNDGLLDVEDYCVQSPTEVIDAIGCDESEQDLDEDGVLNLSDACKFTPDGQQVAEDGCRMPTLFTLSVTANVDDVEVTVTPTDIDAAGVGAAGTEPLLREYAAETTIALTAPARSGVNRFRRWIVNGVEQPDNRQIVTLTTASDAEAEVVYATPVRAEIIGPARLPDEFADGRAYRVTFTLNIVYDDGYVEAADGDITWSLSDEALGLLTTDGELLTYDVSASTAERSATVTAAVEMDGTMIEAEPLALSVFDSDTQEAYCVSLSISGPEIVPSPSTQTFTAPVFRDGEAVSATRPEQTSWAVTLEDGSPAPATIEGGVLETQWTAEGTTLLVRATYTNGNETTCTAEKTVTLLAGNPADEPAAQNGGTGGTGGVAMCGATGAITLGMMGAGLMLLRVGRRCAYTTPVS